MANEEYLTVQVNNGETYNNIVDIHNNLLQAARLLRGLVKLTKDQYNELATYYSLPQSTSTDPSIRICSLYPEIVDGDKDTYLNELKDLVNSSIDIYNEIQPNIETIFKKQIEQETGDSSISNLFSINDLNLPTLSDSSYSTKTWADNEVVNDTDFNHYKNRIYELINIFKIFYGPIRKLSEDLSLTIHTDSFVSVLYVDGTFSTLVSQPTTSSPSYPTGWSVWKTIDGKINRLHQFLIDDSNTLLRYVVWNYETQDWEYFGDPFPIHSFPTIEKTDFPYADSSTDITYALSPTNTIIVTDNYTKYHFVTYAVGYYYDGSSNDVSYVFKDFTYDTITDSGTTTIHTINERDDCTPSYSISINNPTVYSIIIIGDGKTCPDLVHGVVYDGTTLTNWRDSSDYSANIVYTSSELYDSSGKPIFYYVNTDSTSSIDYWEYKKITTSGVSNVDTASGSYEIFGHPYHDGGLFYNDFNNNGSDEYIQYHGNSGTMSITAYPYDDNVGLTDNGYYAIKFGVPLYCAFGYYSSSATYDYHLVRPDRLLHIDYGSTKPNYSFTKNHNLFRIDVLNANYDDYCFVYYNGTYNNSEGYKYAEALNKTFDTNLMAFTVSQGYFLYDGFYARVFIDTPDGLSYGSGNENVTLQFFGPQSEKLATYKYYILAIRKDEKLSAS